MDKSKTAAPDDRNEPLAIQEDIKRSLEHIDVDLSPEARKKLLTRVSQVVHQRTFAGPFPPPEMIDEYERHHPGFLKNLLERSYEAQKHEQILDMIQINGPLEYAKRGQYMGLAIVLGSVIGVCICAFLNQSIAATMLSITGLSPIVGHFIKNPLSNVKESEKSVDRERKNHLLAKSTRKSGRNRSNSM